VPDDPYADPVTRVLSNKLGLDTAEELAAAEREITHAALILLGESPVHPSYDLSHLCAIHRRIFGDIYAWAGQVRTVTIAKGSLFCLPQYIESSSAGVFRALRGENFLQGPGSGHVPRAADLLPGRGQRGSSFPGGQRADPASIL
jgi:cell filamentation protein